LNVEIDLVGRGCVMPPSGTSISTRSTLSISAPDGHETTAPTEIASAKAFAAMLMDNEGNGIRQRPPSITLQGGADRR
jgi:hypothetical protein